MGWGEDHCSKAESWTLWVHDSIDAIWAISVDEFAPIYSWVSSAYWWKDTIPLLFWVSGMSPITSTTGEMNKTKRRGPRTEPCGTPVSEVSQEEDDQSILTKDERWRMNCHISSYHQIRMCDIIYLFIYLFIKNICVCNAQLMQKAQQRRYQVMIYLIQEHTQKSKPYNWTRSNASHSWFLQDTCDLIGGSKSQLCSSMHWHSQCSLKHAKTDTEVNCNLIHYMSQNFKPLSGRLWLFSKVPLPLEIRSISIHLWILSINLWNLFCCLINIIQAYARVFQLCCIEYYLHRKLAALFVLKLSSWILSKIVMQLNDHIV